MRAVCGCVCLRVQIVFARNKTGFEESKEFPVRVGAIVAGRYQILEYLGSAAFSKAVQCLDLVTRRHVCIKIIKNNKDFLDQSLDEIKLLQYINSSCADADEKHVLRLLDYFYFKEHLFIVCELLRENLYEFAKYNRESGDEAYFTLARLQHITKQVRSLDVVRVLAWFFFHVGVSCWCDDHHSLAHANQWYSSVCVCGI